MTAPITPLTSLSDDQLLVELKRLAASERSATAAVIRSLIELDVRRLYLREGCASLFTYCTQVLHYAEGAAYNRIEAARAARRFPVILDALDDGSVTLTTVRLLAPHLTADTHCELLAAARHKSKREIERLTVTLNPQPAVPPAIRKLPERRAAEVVTALSTPETAGPSANIRADAERGTPSPPSADSQHSPGRGFCVSPQRPRAALTPLAPERYKVQLTISRETHDKLHRVQDLLRHTIPTGDLAEIVDRALTLLLDNLERRRCAATPSPRRAHDGTPGSRHIPAAVKREVWKRDEGRCAFIGTQGRCRETAFLEFHHVDPYAAGGEATVDNVSLRCRRHNQHEASLFFARDGHEFVREARPRWPQCAHSKLTRRQSMRAGILVG